MATRGGWLVWIAGGCLACSASTASAPRQVRKRVVYDEDSRVESFDGRDATELARVRGAVVALVHERDLPRPSSEDPNAIWSSSTLAERDGVCPSVTFSEQPAAALCTGLLVERDLVLTAGHCARGLDCEALRLVFGFYYESEAVPHELDADDWYRCREVLSYSIPSALDSQDYGWLRLDREVVGRYQPVPISAERRVIDVGAPVHMFDHGAGLPLKAQFAATVRENNAESLDYFTADLDAFGGSSGAPVLNEEGLVVGILASGSPDYEATDAGCSIPFESPGTEAKERVTYAFRALDGYADWQGFRDAGTPKSAPTRDTRASCSLPPTHTQPALRLGIWIGWFVLWVLRRRAQ